MPYIFVSFRGTYSPKTAASYTKLSSITPTQLSNGDGFLFGIYKLVMEVSHCIIEGIFDLKQRRFKDKRVSIITCGHSLGGGMATIFSYVWKLISVELSSRFEVFSEIGCISIGAPRIFNTSASDRYCQLVEKGKIHYRRITNIGDPVSALPLSKFMFQHPCSTNQKARAGIYQECRSNAKGSYPFVSISDNPLTCSSTGTKNTTTPAAHMLYLNISFVKALNPVQFLTGLGPDSIEVKNPQARIVFYNENIKEVFFNMEDVRSLPRSNDFVVREDDRITTTAFAMLKSNSTEVTCTTKMSGTTVNKENFKEKADSYTSIISKNTPPLEFTKVTEQPDPIQVNRFIFKPNTANIDGTRNQDTHPAAAGGTRRKRVRRRTRRKIT